MFVVLSVSSLMSKNPPGKAIQAVHSIIRKADSAGLTGIAVVSSGKKKEAVKDIKMFFNSTIEVK